MKLLLTIISFSLLLSQQLQVDGNLKVTGEIDAQGQAIKNVGVPQALTDAINGNVLQEALRDDGPFEYLSYKVYVHPEASNNTFKWILLGDGSNISWEHDFVSELNTRALQGFEIYNIMNLPYFTANTIISNGNYNGASATNDLAFALVILKRPLEQN